MLQRTVLYCVLAAISLLVGSTGTPSYAQSSFDGCGTLVEGVECPMLFQPIGSPWLYRLENYGEYPIGAVVHVTGLLNPACISVCLDTAGCIESNTISDGDCQCACACHGDPNCDGLIDVRDFYLVVIESFDGAPIQRDPLCPHPERADLNCDCAVDVRDVVAIRDRVFLGGTLPCDPCLGNASRGFDPQPAPAGALAGRVTGSALGGDSVIVRSRLVIPWFSTVIHVRIVNSTPLTDVVVPLVIRALDTSVSLQSLTVRRAERLINTLTDIDVLNTYSVADGYCKGSCVQGGSPGGFATIGPLAGLPVGVLVSAGMISSHKLSPGSDVSGSIELEMTPEFSCGGGNLLEIDTTCTAPNNHLLFIQDDPNHTAVIPAFTKGVIYGPHECPFYLGVDPVVEGNVGAQVSNQVAAVGHFGGALKYWLVSGQGK